MVAAEVKQEVSDPGSATADIIAYLSKNLPTCSVDVLCYGHVPVSHRQIIKDWLAYGLAQVAVQTDDTVYVVLILEKYCSHMEGVSKGAISNISPRDVRDAAAQGAVFSSLRSLS